MSRFAYGFYRIQLRIGAKVFCVHAECSTVQSMVPHIEAEYLKQKSAESTSDSSITAVTRRMAAVDRSV